MKPRIRPATDGWWYCYTVRGVDGCWASTMEEAYLGWRRNRADYKCHNHPHPWGEQ